MRAIRKKLWMVRVARALKARVRQRPRNPHPKSLLLLLLLLLVVRVLGRQALQKDQMSQMIPPPPLLRSTQIPNTRLFSTKHHTKYQNTRSDLS